MRLRIGLLKDDRLKILEFHSIAKIVTNAHLILRLIKGLSKFKIKRYDLLDLILSLFK